MKLLNALTACLIAIATTASAQTSRMMMPAVSSPAIADDGTELGANTTLTSSGIALGNRVKMRGFVDFRLRHWCHWSPFECRISASSRYMGDS